MVNLLKELQPGKSQVFHTRLLQHNTVRQPNLIHRPMHSLQQLLLLVACHLLLRVPPLLQLTMPLLHPSTHPLPLSMHPLPTSMHLLHPNMHPHHSSTYPLHHPHTHPLHLLSSLVLRLSLPDHHLPMLHRLQRTVYRPRCIKPHLPRPLPLPHPHISLHLQSVHPNPPTRVKQGSNSMKKSCLFRVKYRSYLCKKIRWWSD